MEALSFKLENFEGPFDLLLALISKNKMNIYDIEILVIIDQYLSVVGSLSSENIDYSSEFIEMAARLIHMKSVFLLPKSDEADMLENELTGLLVEYSLMKVVSKKLGDMAQGVNIYVRVPAEVEFSTEYSIAHPPQLIEQSYTSLMGKGLRKRAVEKQVFDEYIAAPVVSVSSRVIHILHKLVKNGKADIQSFFGKGETRSQTVATFLALLELMRAGRIFLEDSGNILLNKSGRKGAGR